MTINKIYQKTMAHKMNIWNFKMEVVELAVEVRLLNENSHNGYIPFKLQHLEQISEFSEALSPSHLQAGYHLNCVPYHTKIGPAGLISAEHFVKNGPPDHFAAKIGLA